jgi:gluconate kinase
MLQKEIMRQIEAYKSKIIVCTALRRRAYFLLRLTVVVKVNLDP